jgi:hypothetical protein
VGRSRGCGLPSEFRNTNCRKSESVLEGRPQLLVYDGCLFGEKDDVIPSVPSTFCNEAAADCCHTRRTRVSCYPYCRSGNSGGYCHALFILRWSGSLVGIAPRKRRLVSSAVPRRDRSTPSDSRKSSPLSSQNCTIAPMSPGSRPRSRPTNFSVDRCVYQPARLLGSLNLSVHLRNCTRRSRHSPIDLCEPVCGIYSGVARTIEPGFSGYLSTLASPW